MKKNKIIKISIIFIIITSIFFIYNNVQAAYISNVESIDESKYPGFKENLIELKSKYPNIQVLYTELDWNTVIKNEHNLAHGRNLVSKSKEEEWICQECKEQGKWYDSGLYCASEEAVKYMMDPRNFLNTVDIFQFQKLNTPVGTNTDEIRKVLQIQKVLYLQDDEASIQAFANVAKQNKLNAYHLITRVIQEQGRNGTSTLSSGLGYTGDGYTNYGYGYYNLFSIGATRKGTDPNYMIYINALDRAAMEGWNSRASSINGGGNFVGANYIDVGQNTLYLQKFAVYNTSGQLYWHQYMQNLFGAQNEANILYDLYNITGIQNDKNFEFLVPIYENMPKQPSRMPGTIYDGYMTSSQFGEIKTDERNIIGTLVVQEWLNGTVQIEPSVNPRVILKANDGETIFANVKYIEPYIYEYSVDVSRLNPVKDYYIEVQCANPNNISDHQIVSKIPCKDQLLGKVYGYNTSMKNNVYTFTYDGYMLSSPYTELSLNQDKLEGLLVIQEWIDGIRQEQPKVTPRIMLVAEDGSKIECEIGYIEPYVYGFSSKEKYIDKTKKYEVQVETGTNKNVSENRVVKVTYKDKIIGKMGIYTIKMQNNKLAFTYDGYMTNSPYTQISLNGTNISGKLIVQEWLDGTVQIEPTTLPKLVIKDTSGEVIKSTTLSYVEPYVYSYNINIGDLNKNTQYTFEVQGTNPQNISNHQNVEVQFENQEIGKIEKNIVKIENGKLIIKEENNNYDGYMTNSPYTQISLNGTNISGKLIVQEWLDGTVQIEPTTLPKLVIKDTSGEVIKSTTLSYVEPYVYSYNINIGDLNKNTQYTFEVQGTNPQNISNHQNVEVNFENQEISNIGNYRLCIENHKLILKL